LSATAIPSGTPAPVLSEIPVTAAGIDLVAGQGGLYHRRYALRGYPRGGLVQTPAGWDFAPAIAGAARTYLQLLTSAGWLLQCWGRDSAQIPVQWVGQAFEPPLEFWDPSQGDAVQWVGQLINVQVETVPQIPQPNPDTGAGATARLGRVVWSTTLGRWDNGVNGEYEVIGTNPGVVYLTGQLPDDGTYVSGGYLQIRPRLYLPIRSYQLEGMRAVPCGPAPKGASRVNAAGPGGSSSPGSSAALPLIPPGIANYAGLVAAYVTPPGTLPTPPPPVVVPPPLPPPPPAFTGKPSSPVPFTCNTLLDLGTALLNWYGFGMDPPAYEPIGLGPINNLDNTWLVICAGGWYEFGAPHGQVSFLSAYIEGCSGVSAYSQALLLYLENTIPTGASLVCIGHSLGGMVLDNLGRNETWGPRILSTVTLASPPVGVPFTGAPVLRFRVSNDLVPWMTLQGIVSGIAGQAGYTLLPHDPANLDFPANHTMFPINPGLASYSPWGLTDFSIATPLVIGQMQRFPVPG